MRPLQTAPTHPRVLAVGIIAAVAVLALAPAAFAKGEKLNKADFAIFKNCPLTVATTCTYGETLSGEFVMGSKTVPITNPVILQGGFGGSAFDTGPLLAPLHGVEGVSATPQPIPGGITGVSEVIGGPAYGVAELVGPPEVVQVNQFLLASGLSPAIEMPIKVHLENELLGENCYIGSDAEPIVLHLTTGKTSPPEGTEPISGTLGTTVSKDHSKWTEFEGNSLVDNTFAVPAATGCGTSVLTEAATTAAVNLAAGLPSAAGKNVAKLDGNLFKAAASDVAKYDRKEIKELEPKKHKG
jgi:hypothetical protein